MATITGAITIRVSLTPGICRWCRCTETRPCANGCAWVERSQTLCSACVPLDTAMRSVKGRQALAAFVQVNIEDDLGLLENPDQPRRPANARARR